MHTTNGETGEDPVNKEKKLQEKSDYWVLEEPNRGLQLGKVEWRGEAGGREATGPTALRGGGGGFENRLKALQTGGEG